MGKRGKFVNVHGSPIHSSELSFFSRHASAIKMQMEIKENFNLRFHEVQWECYKTYNLIFN